MPISTGEALDGAKWHIHNYLSHQFWGKLVEPLPFIDYLAGAGKRGDIFFRKRDSELAWFDLSAQKIEELGFKKGKIAIYE
ncbi:hypothetical protein GmHk_14G040353 [Glycine max]|nr:hypothetical protein GmHk_14G040353 [Glycine max]